MTLKEFFNELNKEEMAYDYIVRIKYKYSFETEDTISNEYLFWDYEVDDYVWFNDWFEGQQNVEVLDYISLDDVFNKR